MSPTLARRQVALNSRVTLVYFSAMCSWVPSAVSSPRAETGSVLQGPVSSCHPLSSPVSFLQYCRADELVWDET